MIGSLDCRAPVALLLADEPAHRSPGTRRRRRTRCSRRPPRGCRCGAATRRTRTTSAGRRSCCSAPTGPSSCPAPKSPAGCPPAQSGARPTRPASAAGSSTSCARSSASRSRPTRRTARAGCATDNVGVQYGLNALQAGQITPEQFVDLNAKVGGIDIDGNFTPERKAADPAALEILYSTGRMNSGSGAADIPEIDNRTGGQMDDTGFHPAFESFAYRARLDRSNGTPRQPDHLAVAPRRRRPVAVRPTCGSGSTSSRPTRAADPQSGQGAAREARRPRGRLLHGRRRPAAT